MKRGTLIGCGIGAAVFVTLAVCGGLVALLVSFLIATTQPVVDASNEFLVLVRDGKTHEAYLVAADGFRTLQDEESFAFAANKLGLIGAGAASWNNRRVDNFEGLAEGTLAGKNGESRPISIRLVYEGGKWKVVGLRVGGVETLSIRAPLPVPPEAECERLVRESLLSFNRAVDGNEFGPFYAELSEAWKKETTPDKLKKIFMAFVDQQIDISPIRNVKPRFAPPPMVDKDNMLIVTGRYATRPTEVPFELKYVREAAAWKLIAIHVSVVKAKDGE